MPRPAVPDGGRVPAVCTLPLPNPLPCDATKLSHSLDSGTLVTFVIRWPSCYLHGHAALLLHSLIMVHARSQI